MVDRRAELCVCAFWSNGKKKILYIWDCLKVRYKMNVFSFDNESKEDTINKLRLHLINSFL